MTTSPATHRGRGSGPRPQVLVVGDVIDDVVVRPLAPIERGTDTPSHIQLLPGGSGANQAAWLAWAGARVRFAGRVGAADVERHARALRTAGVDSVLAADPERPTGTIVVLLDDDGERSMLTDRGANLGLTAADLPDRLLDDVHALHLSGYSLFDPSVREAVLDLVERARRLGVRFTVDPSSAGFLKAVGVDRFLGWADGAEVLLPNLDEARLLAGQDRLEDAAAALLEHVPVVVVTCGAAGALVAARGGTPVTVPAMAADVVDTTGAGDAFAGAFLATWLARADPVGAAALGVAAGTQAVGLPGARPPVHGTPPHQT